MTTLGVLFVSLLFIILIMAVYLLGQADTIKEQKKTLNRMAILDEKLYIEMNELLKIESQLEEIRNERDALRKTLEELN